MTLTRAQVVDTAVGLLRRYGLADLSMRRLARELGVAPGAIYWHVDSKQELIVEVAAVLLEQIPGPSLDLSPGEAIARYTRALRAALLTVPDGADVVGLAHAVDPAAVPSLNELTRAVARLVPVAPDCAAVVELIVHHLLGSVAAEQIRRQAGVVGQRAEGGTSASFDAGLGVILAGVQGARPLAHDARAT
ncbi:MAG: TetR family transcriptional regulator [Terracoccus sp.]